MEFLLNTIRKVDNDQAKEFTFGDEDSLEAKLALVYLHSKDFDKLGLTPSLHLLISSQTNQIIVKVVSDDDVPEGTILMPVSIWSNQLTETVKSEIIYKNLKINVEVTREPVTSFKEIIQNLREGR